MVKVKGDNGKGKDNDDIMNNKNNIIESLLIQLLSNKPNPEFHHISLETRLKYNDDYKRLVGKHMPSLKNRARTFELLSLDIENIQ